MPYLLSPNAGSGTRAPGGGWASSECELVDSLVPSGDELDRALAEGEVVGEVPRDGRQERSVIIGYLEDGPNLVALAMNGWDEGRPAWWLNLEAHPEAVIR